ncbi:unnamed protein product [Pieris brassicae]|uniref:Uncharacterized protein n=1 Tax=Pieris brassicae TaxID=7116 RepID=A0A9P0TUR1_PIEBR|nr:unnamed protein product [Pieris brassicae]
MSIFFFRLHNLRRDEGKMRRYRRNLNADNLTAPSRLLERPLSQPTDSLDEIAFQIPRCNFVSLVVSLENLHRARPM